jgi:citrate lyase subunit beta-like protein
MVCVDFKDDARLKAEAEEGARMGFSGKQAIHPGQVHRFRCFWRCPVLTSLLQVAGIYAAFKASPQDVEFATRIVDENAKHQVGSCRCPRVFS